MKKGIKILLFSFIFGFSGIMGSPLLRAVDPAGVEASAGNLVSSNLVSVTFNGADIQSVLRVLALKGGVNIVAGPEITGDVTIQLQDVPWESAFETIIRTYGYVYEREGNIYHVLTPEALALRQSEGLKTEIYNIEYANLLQVSEALKKTVSGITVEPIAGTNQLMVTATNTNLNMARELLAKVDRRMLQVHIDTKIVRTALTKGESLGINWNTVAALRGSARPTTFPFADDPSKRRFDAFLDRFNYLPTGQTATESTVSTTSGGGQNTATETDFPLAHSFPFVDQGEFSFGTIDFSQFSVMLDMLKSRANTKIVSNPRIVVVNHQTARVQAGREIGIPNFERNETTGAFEISGYEARNDGIQVQVTPHITKNGDIVLAVRPELTRFVGFQQIVEGESVLSPEFETTVAETQVLVNSGDTLVIGGLISEAESDTRQKVPYLSRIPFLGWAFKHIAPRTERTETIIFVTVSLADNVFNQKALDDWRKKQEEYEKFRQETEENFLKKKKKDNPEESNG